LLFVALPAVLPWDQPRCLYRSCRLIPSFGFVHLKLQSSGKLKINRDVYRTHQKGISKWKKKKEKKDSIGEKKNI